MSIKRKTLCASLCVTVCVCGCVCEKPCVYMTVCVIVCVRGGGHVRICNCGCECACVGTAGVCSACGCQCCRYVLVCMPVRTLEVNPGVIPQKFSILFYEARSLTGTWVSWIRPG